MCSCRRWISRGLVLGSVGVLVVNISRLLGSSVRSLFLENHVISNPSILGTVLQSRQNLNGELSSDFFV